MLVVVALGGNALLRRHEPLDAAHQRANIERAATSVAAVARAHDVVVTHGNGPQVGLLALQSEAADGSAPMPLDVISAETEGMIGYVLEQELRRALPGAEVATVLTQVVVDPDDAAFASPTKPIGPVYSAADATRLARARGWAFSNDGDDWRRVVPSPRPSAVVELAAIEALRAAGIVVICAGGGGIPVVPAPGGGLQGVEAVVDKDHASALLARCLGADVLLLLTDVEGAFVDRGSSSEQVVRRADPASIRALPFPPGSMGPKVEAAAAFATRGGIAAIGALEDAARILRGEAGTTVTATADGLTLVPPRRD
ncbi:MAG: carbamate kinase [Acidimicrobiia bacterium]